MGFVALGSSRALGFLILEILTFHVTVVFIAWQRSMKYIEPYGKGFPIEGPTILRDLVGRYQTCAGLDLLHAELLLRFCADCTGMMRGAHLRHSMPCGHDVGICD